MPDTKITLRILSALNNLENAYLSINTLERQPEFKYSLPSVAEIRTIKKALEHSQRLLKILYQRAAAHALKKE